MQTLKDPYVKGSFIIAVISVAFAGLLHFVGSSFSNAFNIVSFCAVMNVLISMVNHMSEKLIYQRAQGLKDENMKR